MALLEKYCDHVNSRELEGSFQNPHFLIVISFFAPVVFALYEMAMHLIKLHADVVNAGGKFASSCLESAAAHARSCILRMLFVCTPARLQKSVANKVGEIKDSTTEQGLNAIDKQIVGHNEGLEEKSSEFQAQANEVFGIELNESEDTESATYEEYKLKQATDEEAREAEMAQSIGFALIHLGLALAVAVDYTNRINSVAVGQSAMCRASKVLVMPLFTAFAISVWNVLMTITNYVHWEWSRQKTPKDVVSDNLIPAPLRPVHRNFLATTVLLTTSAALGIWICAALVVAPALFGFLPVVLALLIAVPLLILVLPLALISWIWGLIPDSVAHLENRRLTVLHAVFSRLNGDGHNIHSISKDELHHHWERTTGHTAERSTHVQHFINKLWDKLDKNKDGKVTIDEFINAAGVGKQWQTSAKESPLPTLTVDKPLQELLMAHPKLLDEQLP